MTGHPDLWDQPDYAGRDRALLSMEMARPLVLAALRDAAVRFWEAGVRPLSVNDLRDAMAEIGYTGDPRILGAVFTRSAGWVPEGFTMVRGSRAHARMIRTFRRVAE